MAEDAFVDKSEGLQVPLQSTLRKISADMSRIPNQYVEKEVLGVRKHAQNIPLLSFCRTVSK